MYRMKLRASVSARLGDLAGVHHDHVLGALRFNGQRLLLCRGLYIFIYIVLLLYMYKSYTFTYIYMYILYARAGSPSKASARMAGKEGLRASNLISISHSAAEQTKVVRLEAQLPRQLHPPPPLKLLLISRILPKEPTPGREGESMIKVNLR